jgi:hypothetical protein
MPITRAESPFAYWLVYVGRIAVAVFLCWLAYKSLLAEW